MARHAHPSDPPTAQASRRLGPFRLGEWRVEPDRLVISSGGEERRLEPKVMDLLLALAARRDRVATHDELIAELWEDRFLTEGVLKHLVWQLRQGLGDDAQHPRYIETVPRRGYRLLAHPAPPHARRRHIPPMVWPLASALGLILVLVASTIVCTLQWPERAATREGQADCVQQIAGGDPAALPSRSTSRGSPVFSPDGAVVAYLHVDEGEGVWSVLAVPSSGGTPRPLTGAEPGIAQDLAWSSEGKWLAVSVLQPGRSTSRILVVDLAEEVVRPLTRPPSDTPGDLDPAFSPNGREVVFRRRAALGVDDLLAVPVTGGAPRRITPRRFVVADGARKARAAGTVERRQPLFTDSAPTESRPEG